MSGKNKKGKSYMLTTWQTVLALEVQLHVTLLYLFSPMVLLKPVHEVGLWPKIQCVLFRFEDIILRVFTVTK